MLLPLLTLINADLVKYGKSRTADWRENCRVKTIQSSRVKKALFWPADKQLIRKATLLAGFYY
jgi:hypothetical protein